MSQLVPRWSWRVWLVIGIALLPVLCVLMIPLMMLMPPEPRVLQASCRFNLKVLALALNNYHLTYGEYPPAMIVDDQGRPMHSWRVLLLPYLEQKPLYDRYRFDEPWNGPHNRQLLAEIPWLYRCPTSPADSTDTDYVLLLGGPSAYDERGVPLPHVDRQMVLLVEAGDEKIPWMAPQDLPAANLTSRAIGAPGGINSGHPRGAHVARADSTIDLAKPGEMLADALERLENERWGRPRD